MRPDRPSAPCAARRRPGAGRTLVRAFADDPVANFMFAGVRRRRARPALLLHLPAPPPVPSRRPRVHHRGPGRGGDLGIPRPSPQRAGRAGPATPDGAVPRQHPHAPGPAAAVRGGRAPPEGAPLVPGHAGHRARAPGQGVGSALLQPVLDRADEDGMPGLPRVVQGAERPVLRPVRLRGDRGAALRSAAARRSGACGGSRGHPSSDPRF